MVVALFGLIWMIKGEIKISQNRKISKDNGQKLGAFMFFGSIATMFVPIPDNYITFCSIIWVLLPIIIGLAIAEKTGFPANEDTMQKFTEDFGVPALVHTEFIHKKKKNVLRDLSQQEQSVLNLLLEGFDDSGIAYKLGFSASGTKMLKHSILKKFGVDTNVDLIELFKPYMDKRNG